MKARCNNCGALAYPQTGAAASAGWRRLAQDLYAVLLEVMDRPNDAILCTPTFHKARAALDQAAALLDVSPTKYLSSALPIVIPAPDAAPDVRALFQGLHPGSVAVAIQRGPGSVVEVYYEGGLYTYPRSGPASHRGRGRAPAVCRQRRKPGDGALSHVRQVCVARLDQPEDRGAGLVDGRGRARSAPA